MTGQGSIPAWAGQPNLQLRAGMYPRVYPRVGGATPGCADGITRS